MTEDMLDLLRRLEEYGVEYLIIGGVAVNLHGYSRNTKNINIWVADSEANLLRLYEALTAWYGGTPPIEKRYLLSHKGVFVLGLMPDRIDLLTEVSGGDFSAAYPNRLKVEHGGVTFDVISFTDLIRLKKVANRRRDQDDVDNLEKIKAELERRNTANGASDGASEDSKS